MTKQILKVVTLGILGGLALFAFPFFVLKAVIFIVLLGFIFRLFIGRRRFGRGFGPGFAFAEGGNMKQHFQNMTREERKAFFEKMKQHGCGVHGKDEKNNPENESK